MPTFASEWQHWGVKRQSLETCWFNRGSTGGDVILDGSKYSQEGDNEVPLARECFRWKTIFSMEKEKLEVVVNSELETLTGRVRKVWLLNPNTTFVLGHDYRDSHSQTTGGEASTKLEWMALPF